MSVNTVLSIGTCSIFLNGVNVGFTKGGVELEIETTTKSVSYDNFTRVVKRNYITDRKAKISFSLAEADISKLSVTLPATTYIENIYKKIVAEGSQGFELIANSGVELLLRPFDAVDENRDIYFPLAYTTGNTSMSFTWDNEVLFPVEFEAVEDENNVLFIIGNRLTDTFDAILQEEGGYLLYDDETVFILEEN